MSEPLIALVGYHLPAGRITRWETGGHVVPDTYIDSLRRAGGRPVILPTPDTAESDPVTTLEPFSGLLLIGGGDVDPSRYGAERHPEVYGADPSRDSFEIDLVMAADSVAMPVLAICRGAQVVNVAFGGTLFQHLPDVPDLIPHGVPAGGGATVHEVKVSESSRLAEACGRAAITCHSHHHQGLDGLGEGLVPVAWSEDGLVEAVERRDGWCLAVQWHPEDTAATDPSQQALFDGLVAEVRRYGTS